MSLIFTRWQAFLYYSNTDVSSGSYNIAGEVNKSVLDGLTLSYATLNISQVGYQVTPTNELAVDISGRPYNKKRGFTDTWTLQLTPYYFTDTGSYASVLSVSSDIATSLQYRHLWLYFNGVDQESTLVTNNKAVKVVYESFTEVINNESASRTATLKFQRKFRVDTLS